MDLASAKLLSFGRVIADSRWHLDGHSHPFHELIVLLSGRLGVEIAGEIVEAGEGDVLVYPLRVVHREWAAARAPFESFCLAFEWSAVTSSCLVRSSDDRGRIRQIVRWLEEEQHTGFPLVGREREALFQAALAETFREKSDRENELVRRTRRYIRQNMTGSITLDGLASHAGLSKYYFVRTYRRLTGHTPMEDVRAIRLDHARTLILTTNLRLKEIAPRSGLGNEYSLSRLFRRVFGTPPGQFRRPGRREPQGRGLGALDKRSDGVHIAPKKRSD